MSLQNWVFVLQENPISFSDDISPIYLEKLCSTTFAHAYPTCKDWFLDVFYERLFDIHPVSLLDDFMSAFLYKLIYMSILKLCKPMFKSAMSKGSFIHGLLAFLFNVLVSKKEFHAKLLQIAESHCKKGVKAIEYGIIGEVNYLRWNI